LVEIFFFSCLVQPERIWDKGRKEGEKIILGENILYAIFSDYGCHKKSLKRMMTSIFLSTVVEIFNLFTSKALLKLRPKKLK
jgi:hypothetical protein